jgi:RNA polymerase sigma-70 factor (ECF subfamily)
MSAERDKHLSQISTLWTVLAQAHGPQEAAARQARDIVLQRYQTAIYRYFLGAVHDPDQANELFQDFVVRFLRGDLRTASPEKGKFRHFLKTCLYHLIVDHQRKRKRQGVALDRDIAEPARDEQPGADADARFLEIWRTELMNRTWEALRRHEEATGQDCYSLLRCRADHPDASMEQIAETIGGQRGQPVTAGWVRKRLFVARGCYADLLLQEVAQSLDQPSREELAMELIDLGLFEYCRVSLKRWQP